jgi:hypothetical protein
MIITYFSDARSRYFSEDSTFEAAIEAKLAQ